MHRVLRALAPGVRRAIEIQLLGPVEVADGETSLHLGDPKQRAVLTMLALNPHASASVDRLLDGLRGATKVVQLGCGTQRSRRGPFPGDRLRSRLESSDWPARADAARTIQ